ncbi:MAG: isoprenyl transferase [candidate division Zixibacteria bacterium]|nr:isoprenyl transferase [candidate division Zixibacteria bacterium]
MCSSNLSLFEGMICLAEENLKEKILKKGNLPRHIAIIMDGNGRWAKRRGLPRIAGHRAGVKTVKRIVEAAGELKLSILTLFTFSVENWQRPREEVSAIMNLLYETTKRELSELEKNNVKLITTGKIEELSLRRKEILEKAIQRTKDNTGLVLNLALNYSGRSEILDAVKKISLDISFGIIKPEEVDEKLFSSYLYTKELPDPDLLIRTSGEMRLSNFMLWQTSYTELYVTEVLWPDFSVNDFYQAIWAYQNRQRRFGKI